MTGGFAGQPLANFLCGNKEEAATRLDNTALEARQRSNPARRDKKMIVGQNNSKPSRVWSAGVRQDDDRLVTFVAWQGLILGHAHSTIHVRLYSIRWHSLVATPHDCLKDKPLLKLLMRALKKLRGGARRKIAVTVDQLRRAIAMLDLEDFDGLLLDFDGLLLAFALTLAFSFLLQSG